MDLKNSNTPKKTGIKFKTDKVKLPLLGLSTQKLVGFGIDTNWIISNFILALIYLFVALEEADYQILSASKTSENENFDMLDENDPWALKSLLFRQ